MPSSEPVTRGASLSAVDFATDGSVFARPEASQKAKKKGWGALLGVPSRKKKKKHVFTAQESRDDASVVSDVSSAAISSAATPTGVAYSPVGNIVVGPAANAAVKAADFAPHSMSAPPEDNADNFSVISGATGLSGVSNLPPVDTRGVKKKKKNLLQKVFGKSHKHELTSEALAKLNREQPSAASNLQLPRFGRPSLDEDPTSPRTPEKSDPWDKQRALARQDCLHALSLIQQRFFVRLAQEEARLKSLRHQHEQRNQAAGLSSVPYPDNINADVRGLTRLVLEGKDLGSLSKIADQIDWTSVDSRPLGDALQTLFIIHKLRAAVEGFFDRESYNQFQANLCDAGQLRQWTSQNGYLTLAPPAIRALTTRVECVEQWQYSEALQQVKQTTAEVERLRQNLRAAIHRAFSRVAAEPVFVEKGCESVFAEQERIVMPEFLRDSLQLHTYTHPREDYDEEGGGEEFSSLAAQAAAALKKSAKPRGENVGPGFKIVCGVEEFAAAERVLRGRWGSYRLFEKWLKDAVHWQWLDMNCYLEFGQREKNLALLVEHKKEECFAALDQKLSQIWQGRMLLHRHQNVLSLQTLLREAAHAQAPMLRGRSDAARECAVMAEEDVRAHWRRFTASKLFMEFYKSTKHHPQGKFEGDLRSVADVETLMADLNEMRFQLRKKGDLIQQVNIHADYSALKRKVEGLRKHLNAVAAENEKSSEVGTKKKAKAEAEYQELLGKIAKEEEKQRQVKNLLAETEDVALSLSELQEKYKAAKALTVSLEEQKASAKAERKKKAAEAARLEKHLAAETKRHAELEQAFKKERDKESAVSATAAAVSAPRQTTGAFNWKYASWLGGRSRHRHSSSRRSEGDDDRLSAVSGLTGQTDFTAIPPDLLRPATAEVLPQMPTTSSDSPLRQRQHSLSVPPSVRDVSQQRQVHTASPALLTSAESVAAAGSSLATSSSLPATPQIDVPATTNPTGAPPVNWQGGPPSFSMSWDEPTSVLPALELDNLSNSSPILQPAAVAFEFRRGEEAPLPHYHNEGHPHSDVTTRDHNETGDHLIAPLRKQSSPPPPVTRRSSSPKPSFTQQISELSSIAASDISAAALSEVDDLRAYSNSDSFGAKSDIGATKKKKRKTVFSKVKKAIGGSGKALGLTKPHKRSKSQSSVSGGGPPLEERTTPPAT